MTREIEYGPLIRTTGNRPWWLDNDEIVQRPLPLGPSERKAAYVTTWNHDFRIRADHPFYGNPVAELVGAHREENEARDETLSVLKDARTIIARSLGDYGGILGRIEAAIKGEEAR